MVSPSINSESPSADDPSVHINGEIDADDLLRMSSDLSSLVAGIQALARDREDDPTFAHIVNLADITSDHLDELHRGIDRMRADEIGSASEVEETSD